MIERAVDSVEKKKKKKKKECFCSLFAVFAVFDASSFNSRQRECGEVIFETGFEDDLGFRV
jgi:hypothetical protein